MSVIGPITVILLVVSCGTPAAPPLADIATAAPILPAATSATPWPRFTPPPPAFAQQPIAPEPVPTLTPLPPPAGQPTALPAPPPPDIQAQLAGARVDLSAQLILAAVGEFITLTGRPTNLGLPQYTLYLRGEPAVIIRYDGEIIFRGFSGAEVELVSASASQSEAIFVLRAAQPGKVAAMMSVSGEVRLDTTPVPTTAFAWSSVTSPVITLTVAAPVAATVSSELSASIATTKRPPLSCMVR